MASELALEVTVEVGEGAKSLKALKQEFRESQKELDGLTVGSDKYVASLKKLGRIKDEIGDLNQEIKSFNPEGKVQAVTTVVGGLASGFQAATGAAALFGGESKDLEKALLKVQAVMAFTEGIKGLVSLGDGFKVLGNIIKANPIGAFITALTALATIAVAVYESIDRTSESTKQLTKAAERQKEVVEGLTGVIKRQVELLTAQGASEEEIIKTKKRLIDAQIAEVQIGIQLSKSKINDIKNNDTFLESSLKIEASLFRKIGLIQQAEALELAIVANKLTRAKEDIDAIKKAEEDLKNFQNARLVLDAEYSVKKKEIAKKTAEDIKTINQKASEDYLVLLKKDYDEQKILLDKIQEDKEASRLLEYDAEIEAQQRKNKDKLAQVEIDQINNNLDLEHKKSNLMIQQQVELDNANLTENQILLIKIKYQKLSDRLDAEAKQKSLDNAQKLTQGLQALSDIVFITRSANLKKGSKEEKELAEKQFKVNKALQLASATITGIKAVMAAYAAGMETGGPYAPLVGAAYAALAALESGAIIAKIASTQFDSGGGGSSSVADIGGGSVGGGGVPTINAPSSGNTQLNPNGTVVTNPPTQPTNTTVTVVETDIRITQDRVRMIENNAKI